MKTLDKAAFEELFRTHFVPLCHYARGMVADLDQSKDLVQQSFIKIWQKKEEMDLSKSIKSYLYTSVRNACINHLRDHKKFRNTTLDVDIFDQLSGEGNRGETNKMIVEELSQKIETALNNLPEKSLITFKMSRYENMKYKEIAEKLGVTVKTVEAHMSRALRLLREDLKDYLVSDLAWIIYWWMGMEGFSVINNFIEISAQSCIG